MATFIAWMKQRPLTIFFILAYAFTWALTPLIRISPMLGVPGLLMPAVAAILVVTWTEGRAGLRELFGRLARWRVGLIWYLVALGLPILLSLAVVGLSLLLGVPAEVQLAPITPLAILVFVLVIGEELGWRGYALPQLLRNHSAVMASLILGLLWACWHLPTFFVPDTPQAQIPFVAYIIYVLGMSVLFTWIFVHTQGSVLIATLFHGAINTFGFLNEALSPELRWWLTAAVYAVSAAIVVLATGINLRRSAIKQPKSTPDIAPS